MRTIARATSLALLIAALVVPPAAAADVVKIRGGGWGHGIGMSQYGAYGRAKNGAGAAEILRHYYSGVRLSKRRMPRRIRVGLVQYKDSIAVTSSARTGGRGKVVFKIAGTDGPLATGGGDAQWRVEASNTGGLRLYKNGEQIKENGVGVHGSPEQPLALIYEPYGTKVHPQYKPEVGYAYGRMEFDAYPSDRCAGGFCLRLIVVLSMQKYLYGLGEVPSSWPQAVLRAQAMAGRTYAYDKIQRSGQHREPCDCAVFDSVVDQAYIGEGKRDAYFEQWKAAVDATKNKVILHKGSPIQALYSSSSGGHTENNENVWGGTPIPYLRGVQDRADAVDANPNHEWSFEITYNEFETRLDRAYGIGNLKDFKLLKPFGVSGRVTVVKSADRGGARIVGSNKVVRESGWSLRSALGLKDTLFRVRFRYDVDERFDAKHRALDGRPGDATSASYAVPRGAERVRGRAQDFQRGRMTWRKKTGKVTWQRGPILRRYDAMGREKGRLGMPTSDVWGPGNYLGAMYVRGMIMWSQHTGARPVLGRFKREYVRNGGPQGALGLPKARAKRSRTLPGDGRLQRFTNGTIYLNPRRNGGVFALWGAIGDRYRRMGEGRSDCGYPTASMVADGDGATATFENGTIETRPSGGLRVAC